MTTYETYQCIVCGSTQGEPIDDHDEYQTWYSSHTPFLAGPLCSQECVRAYCMARLARQLRYVFGDDALITQLCRLKLRYERDSGVDRMPGVYVTRWERMRVLPHDPKLDESDLGPLPVAQDYDTANRMTFEVCYGATGGEMG